MRRRAPRPGNPFRSASARPAAARSPPSASTAAMTASALFTQCAPAMPTEKVRSEEHTSELQSLMRTSYAVFCLKKKQHKTRQLTETQTPLIQQHIKIKH